MRHLTSLLPLWALQSRIVRLFTTTLQVSFSFKWGFRLRIPLPCFETAFLHLWTQGVPDQESRKPEEPLLSVTFEKICVLPFGRLSLEHRAPLSWLQLFRSDAGHSHRSAFLQQCLYTAEQWAHVHGMHTKCLLSFCQEHHQIVSLSPNKSRSGLQSWQEKQTATLL